MDFNDYFKNKQHHHDSYDERRSNDDYRHSYNSYHPVYRHNNHMNCLNILEKIRGNNKLKLFIILAAIIIISIGIILIIMLLPIVIKLIDFVNQNGLQGLLDVTSDFLEKIWKGTAN
jgi:hypothetical protein